MNPQLVVAAVSQAYEGMLVNAVDPGRATRASITPPTAGLAGRWRRSRTGPGRMCRGRTIHSTADGNAATSVVWNPVRSCLWRRCASTATTSRRTASPGRGWRRSPAEPTVEICPSNAARRFQRLPHLSRQAGGESADRGHVRLDVDEVNQDQGIWQDECAVSAGACASANELDGEKDPVSGDHGN